MEGLTNQQEDLMLDEGTDYDSIGVDDPIKVINDLIQSVAGKSVAYIKLIKNRNGYNWEIKQLSLDLNDLEKINNELLTKFGGEI